jgi:hypothetical protein
MIWEGHGLSKAQGGMGFRDLVCFNKALLAKQCWRLLQNQDSLVAQIIKAKYYPSCTILEAKLCKRPSCKCPSFAWRSILGAGSLLKQWLIW